MAKPHAGFNTPRPSSARSAARTTAGSSSTDTTPLAPTSIPRADLSSSGAKAGVTSAIRTPSGSSSSTDLSGHFTRSSVGSSSSTDLSASTTRDIASIVKEVGKRLDYEDDSPFPTAASLHQPMLAPEGLADLAPLLELPDPDNASSTTVVSASDADAKHAMTASVDSTVTQVAAPADFTADGPLLTEMEGVLAELSGARGLSPRSKRLLLALVEVADAELNANPTAAVLHIRRAAFWRKVRVGILAATVFSVAAIDAALAFALYGARHGNDRYHHVLPPT
ncbi:uncharacterized protein LOC119319321 [Triticum dicoccoides]|uniref:uncharacterized protein LOC119319321 n=1 Tax=Triticum dicoccoides TaxID=85692 RepID=UPI000E799BA8|nr:uncharacterized protein LOC119319321 [Triticum dicoccoides]